MPFAVSATTRSGPSPETSTNERTWPANVSSRSRWLRRPPPDLGQHTDAVLGEVGYSGAEIAAMRESGAVGPRS